MKNLTRKQIQERIAERKPFKIKIESHTEYVWFKRMVLDVPTDESVGYTPARYPTYVKVTFDAGLTELNELAFRDSGLEEVQIRAPDESDVDFKTQAEVWAFLIAGGTVRRDTTDGGYRYFKLINGTLHGKTGDGSWEASIASLAGPSNYSKVHWYDDIPEHGILCWVSDTDTPADDGSEAKKIIRLVVRIVGSLSHPTEKRFDTVGGSWRFAHPLTPAEARQVIYGGDHEL